MCQRSKQVETTGNNSTATTKYISFSVIYILRKPHVLTCIFASLPKAQTSTQNGTGKTRESRKSSTGRTAPCSHAFLNHRTRNGCKFYNSQARANTFCEIENTPSYAAEHSTTQVPSTGPADLLESVLQGINIQQI